MEADHRDQTIQSFAQNILRLGNECRALSKENAYLKAEVERLNNLIISGGAVTADPEIYP